MSLEFISVQECYKREADMSHIVNVSGVVLSEQFEHRSGSYRILGCPGPGPEPGHFQKSSGSGSSFGMYLGAF